ncbi:MAG TPA: DUF4976 domain-containing protein, partial [Candidatus Handelsmanbacteria bacterium]|nr:DUF4976 domain-containing protein [Candidatus Handelsmanbacteria bacterium]
NIGKMHLTPQDEKAGFHERTIVENPTNKTHANGGADDDWGRFLTHHGQQRPNDRHRTDPDWKQKHQGVPWHLQERFHSDVFIGDAAVSWIRAHQGDRPLFLQVGFTGPHEPWDPLPRHLEAYRDRPMPAAIWRAGELEDKPPQHKAHRRTHAEADHESLIDLDGASADDIAEMRRHYYANITTVDEKLGEVLEALEERGWLEDTILVFCSDHGELLGDHQLAYKWLMYDAITHVPLIIRDGRGGRLQRAGESVHDLVSLVDLGPTLLQAAGVAVPTYLEGQSLLPYLETPHEVVPREFVFAEDNYQVMMRSSAHKLVYYIGQISGELYDLQQDPHELHNIWDSKAHQGLRQELTERLLAWLAASTYYNAGYRRNRSHTYNMRWPRAEDPYLHGRMSSGGPRTTPL